MWINHHSAFAKLAQGNQDIRAKYEFFENIFGNWYIFDDMQAANLTTENSRAFDSTLYIETITQL